MTVKAIRLENFMAFADTGWIELRPITLLFGRNSSGKSAIIRALRLLRQNLEQPTDERYTLRFNSEHGVALGDYTETVHGKETDRVMRFHFRCDVPAAADAARREINQWRQPNNLPDIVAGTEDTLTLALTFGYDPHREAELVGIDVICNWQITAVPGSHTLLSAVWLGREMSEEVGYEWWLDTDLPSWQALDWQATSFRFPQNFLPQLEDAPTDILPNVLSNLAQSIAIFLKGMEYQPPIRPEPQRVYVLDEIARQRWRQQGWAALVDFLEGNRLDEPTETKIDSWLDCLELGLHIEPPTEHSSKDATVSKIVIKEKGAGLPVNLKNTGYGASQVIPVIVQSVTARQRVEEKTAVCVVIEQPELHLHPRAQARLTDMFVDEIYQIDTRQVEKKGDELKPTQGYREHSDVRFLLETHSEHSLLRLQKRVTETAVGINDLQIQGKNRYLVLKDLSVYFIKRDAGASSVESITLNEYGEFTEFPDEFETFFADDLIEAGELAKLRLKARAKRRETIDNSSS
ncbi:MAG: AAA family ATPase [Chloroflexi bacterium]|nr:AAA family ATPase [Ardenticatenaceae bacterium]MBL1127889.1 hypothetical protein [Chloroflexota bacterium]NOG33959.1 AAA family ATPase [Chloroflexota bacterium]GIK55643.1 MAG: hypothetical protein BroJett015_13060 [Chloroflexota bacterium]